MVDYPNYANFLSDMIGGLPNDARQAQSQQNVLQQQQNQLADQQRRQALQRSFAGGLPMENGQLNYAETMNRLAQGGDYSNAINLAPSALEQQQRQDAQKGNSLLDGAPPASAAANVSTRPQSDAQAPQAPQGGPSPRADAGGAAGRSVDDIVSSSLPAGSPQSQTVAANIARVLKVDPNSPLTPEQMAKAQRFMAGYSDRKGAAPAAAPSQAMPLFAAAGAQYGISPAFLARTAQIESGGNPNAKNPSSSAKGLFEFTDGTAKKYGLTNPYDPVASTDAAARLAADNRDSLTRSLGRAPSDAELYLAHQQGAGGAAALLKNPDAKASDVVGMKAVIQNGGRPDMTAGQFAKLWTDKYSAGGAGALGGDMMAMRQPMQGVAMPSGTTGATPAAAAFPQITPQGPVQQPQPAQFQALAAGGAGGAGAAPAPVAPPQAQATPQAPAQPQPRPLVEPVPLPKGFKDPQQAILAIDREIAKLSVNPYAKGQIAALTDWRERIAEQTKPTEVRPGMTLVDPRTGQTVFQAPSANPKTAAFDRFIEQHPDATPEQMQAFIQSGQAPRSGVAAFMNKYLQENPGASAEDVARAAQNFQAGTSSVRSFDVGKQGDATRSFNVLVDHLGVLTDTVGALKNGDVRQFNKLGQEFAKQTGNAAPTNFDAVKTLVGDEIVKAVVGGAGALGDREEVKSVLDRANSPEQLYGVIESYKRLAVGQLHGLEQQYRTSTGRDDFRTKLSPGTLGFFEGKSEGGKGDAGAPAKVSSKAEFDALPSGAEFIAPDGSHRRKP